MLRRLELHVFPYIGKKSLELLTAPDLLEVLRRIESRGTYDLAHRVRSICSRVFRFARATGRQCQDLAADLIGSLTPVEKSTWPQSWNLGALERCCDRLRLIGASRLPALL